MVDGELLSDLTGPQCEAVMHADGPLLVLAGAGSGKTRVITRRAAHLSATAARGRGVLAITFTNKAAGEMRDRVSALGVGHGVRVSTFHSLGARLLREYAPLTELQPNFTIYDTSDRLSAIRDAIEACGLSADHWRPRTVEYRISHAKNAMWDAAQFAESARDFQDREIARIYASYEKLMLERNAVDFDDLLLRTARLLETHADVRDMLEERFPYLLIDEYQDTNYPQYLIATLLAKKLRNICATGDPDQSIYGWRGANIKNILNFEEDYPDARVVRLEQNYRSTPEILRAASELIGNNHRRKKKELWTENTGGGPVRVYRCTDEIDEARRLAEAVTEHIAAGGVPGDVAIFYRVTALTRVLEDALRRAKIPYQIARGVEFYARKEIKDVLAYLRLIVNPKDDLAFARALNTPPRGIGKTTLDRLTAAAKANRCSRYAAIEQAEAFGVARGTQKKLAAFRAMVEEFRGLATTPVRPLLEAVLAQSGLDRALKDDPDPEQEALGNVNELVTAASEFDSETGGGTLGDWLEQISLVSDTDRMDESGGSVTLMTLHAAKGLEFPMVFIVGLEDDLLPHRRAMEEGDDNVEEERRLCFVGMTRAMKRLSLSYADYRTVRGFTQRTIRSRFLKELPEDEIEMLGHREVREDGYDPSFDVDESFDPNDWMPGRRVRHPDYGEGYILRLEPRGRLAFVRVQFEEGGERSFSVEHAPLSFIEA